MQKENSGAKASSPAARQESLDVDIATLKASVDSLLKGLVSNGGRDGKYWAAVISAGAEKSLAEIESGMYEHRICDGKRLLEKVKSMLDPNFGDDLETVTKEGPSAAENFVSFEKSLEALFSKQRAYRAAFEGFQKTKMALAEIQSFGEQLLSEKKAGHAGPPVGTDMHSSMPEKAHASEAERLNALRTQRLKKEKELQEIREDVNFLHSAVGVLQSKNVSQLSEMRLRDLRLLREARVRAAHRQKSSP